MKKKQLLAQIADEIEHWAVECAIHGEPDVLSMTEVVAENWQEIVEALRAQERQRKGVGK